MMDRSKKKEIKQEEVQDFWLGVCLPSSTKRKIADSGAKSGREQKEHKYLFTPEKKEALKE